jgi:hypothetical protein
MPAMPAMAPAAQPLVAAAMAPAAATQIQQAAAQPAATPKAAPRQATVEIVPAQFPDESSANEEIDGMPDSARQGRQAFEARLNNEMDEVAVSRDRRGRQPVAEDNHSADRARPGRAADWRSATYLARDERRHDSPMGELGDGRPSSDTRRPARARRMEDRKVRRREIERSDRGHLEALARRPAPDAGQRFANRKTAGVVRDASSRKERTEAARALLEQVMARRARDDR